MNNKSILIFGAGKIGRSFIGQLFGQAGYQVVFTDTDHELVNELNRRKSYPVVIKGMKEETILVQNVRAIPGSEKDKVVHEIAETALLAVSVGMHALDKVVPVIAEGIKLRHKISPGLPLNIIIAENMRSAATYLSVKLEALLPTDFPLGETTGLIETSIGKMVPLMSHKDKEKDPLLVFAEPYNTLILDKKGFKGAIPDVPGLSLKDNIKAWVDRKAFIHNMGHATAAWLIHFYHPQLTYLHEGLEYDSIRLITKNTMKQAAAVLIDYYPDDFTVADLEEHIDDLLLRFRNKALKDTVFRVGQDLMRKLAPDDRFGGIIQMARNRGLGYNLIADAMAYGLFFKAKDDLGRSNPQDDLFLKTLEEKGVKPTLNTCCSYNSDSDNYLLNELDARYLKLNKEHSFDK